MAQDVDTIYLALRTRILAGEWRPQTVLNAAELEQEFSTTDRKLRQVLNSLVGDGYLGRVQNVYSVPEIGSDEIEEWRQILCSLFELGAARLILDGQRLIPDLQRLHRAIVAAVPASDERFFVSAMQIYAVMLGGQSSTLTAFANQLVPPMFFRLLWLAEIESGDGVALRTAIDGILNAAGRRDVSQARQACRTYCDDLSAALHRQLDQRNAGNGPDLLGSIELTVERRITYHVNYLTTPSAPKQLLPRLLPVNVASVKGFLPD